MADRLNRNDLLERVRLSLTDPSSWLDFARGGLMGATTDTLGYPVDVVTMALRPLGYNVEKPVGGSDWLASQLTSPTGSNAEMAGRVVGGMLSPDTNDLLRMMGVLEKRAPVQELTTYHGSRHRFPPTEKNPLGEFELPKVGSGTGFYTEGYGAYLAQNPKVGRSYLPTDKSGARGYVGDTLIDFNKLEDTDQFPQVAKQLGISERTLVALPGESPNLWDLEKALAAQKAKVEQIKKWVGSGEGATDYGRSYLATEQSVLSELENLKTAGVSVRPYTEGHFYTADIPDDAIEKMLDLDAPISSQPRHIQEALRDAGNRTIGRPYEFPPETSGYDAYHKIAEDFAGIDRHSVMNDAAEIGNTSAWIRARHAGMQQASEFLLSRDVPGSKYFDAGSRAAGEGTRNFVIFDPDIAKILKRE